MATLTTTIVEELNLNNKTRGSKNVSVTSNITQVFHRIYEVDPTYQSTIIGFTPYGDNGYIFNEGDVRYFRITNLDASNTVRLNILGTSEEYFVDLPPKGSFMMNNDTMDANDSGLQTPTMNQIASVRALTTSGTADVEVFAAGVTS